MNHSTLLQTPIIGYATRTGKRHPLNDDQHDTFVVLRENTTRRLARRCAPGCSDRAPMA